MNDDFFNWSDRSENIRISIDQGWSKEEVAQIFDFSKNISFFNINLEKLVLIFFLFVFGIVYIDNNYSSELKIFVWVIF